MNAFIVELENRPGMAAEVAEAIAERGINLTGAAGAACGGCGSFVVATNDEAGTRRVLESRHFTFREVEVVPATLADTPGTIADALRKIASAGVNLEAMFVMGPVDRGFRVAFLTDNPTAARSALGQLAATTR